MEEVNKWDLPIYAREDELTYLLLRETQLGTASVSIESQEGRSWVERVRSCH